MPQSHFAVARTLSILIALLATLASLGGFYLLPYRDNKFLLSAWSTNDLVTLALAVPLLILSMILARRGSLRGTLLWFGMLDYMLYNYAFYLFGAAFNSFFLIYVAIIVLAILALIFGLANLDVDRIAGSFSSRTPVKIIAGYMFFVALGLSIVYTAQWGNFVATGALPPIVELSGHPTSVVFALDLTLVVPFMILGGYWLWKRRPWGYVLAGITITKGVIYTLVLFLGSSQAAVEGYSEAASERFLWLGLTVLGGIAAALLFRNLGRAGAPTAG